MKITANAPNIFFLFGRLPHNPKTNLKNVGYKKNDAN
jgi:hypothetical protein